MLATEVEKNKMRFAMLGFHITLLGLAVWAALLGPLQAPTFSPSARGISPENAGWHSGTVHTPYLRKTYEMSLARGWLELALKNGSPDVRVDAVGRARLHARAAIEMAPANGYAWAALAWAEMLAGRRAKAEYALARARDWTPSSPNLALDRALVAQTWWPEMNDQERTLVLDDVRLAGRAYGHRFRQALADSPRLAALWRLAKARDE